MSETMADITFNFGAFASDWTPYSGDGGTDRLTKDGLFLTRPLKYELSMSAAKDGKEAKPMMLLYGQVVGEGENDPDSGKQLVTNIMLGGKDTNGDDLGRQFLDFLASSGTPVAAIQELIKGGAKTSIKDVMAKIIAEGRLAVAVVETQVYKGEQVSRVSGWRLREKYDQAKTVGAHRKAYRVVTATTAASPQTVVAGGVNLAASLLDSLGGSKPATVPNGATSAAKI